MSVEFVSETENQSPSVTDVVLEVVPELLPGPNPGTASTDDLISTLKSGSCPSLTGRSILGFQLGCKGNAEFYLRIVSNTGSGFFSKDWVPCLVIEQLIAGATELTSTSFKIIFPNKSVNTGGFFMAVIKELGLIQTNVDNSRWHEHVSGRTFGQVAVEAMAHEAKAQKVAGTKGKRNTKEG
jgi:hypothetical protein